MENLVGPFTGKKTNGKAGGTIPFHNSFFYCFVDYEATYSADRT